MSAGWKKMVRSGYCSLCSRRRISLMYSPVGPWSVLHAHQDFAIAGPNRGIVAQQQVDGDDGQADVVEHQIQLLGRNHAAE